ncbi:hypothetical protein F4776DRAFT_196093 [Hypoxylon sp. NC0597]|nr:hypothetical protein F4776DRAFT_196093 [Hypoxylon sp. NC0597]
MAIHAIGLRRRNSASDKVTPKDDHRFWDTKMDMDMKEDDDEDDKILLKRDGDVKEEMVGEMEMEEKESKVGTKGQLTDYRKYSTRSSDVDSWAPKQYETNHRNTVRDTLSSRAETGASIKAPASPERDQELEQIVAHINQQHCDKYKWYIERHIRTIFVPKAQPSRQLYYRRVMQINYTKENHTTEQIFASPRNKERFEVRKMRPSAFPRIDYEATFAQYTARQTSHSLAWATSKKRVPADKLGAVLHEAVEAYGWPEIVTDAIVDEILKRDGIRDLDAFEKYRRGSIAAYPAVNRISSEKEPEFDPGNMAADSQDMHEQESQLRQSTILRQSLRSGSISGSKQDQLSILPPYQFESMSQHDAEENPRTSNKVSMDKKERRERKKRLRRQREQKMASLEELRLKFEQDMKQLFAEYGRQRSEIEAQFSDTMNCED